MFVILLLVNCVWAPFVVPRVREWSIQCECRNISAFLCENLCGATFLTLRNTRSLNRFLWVTFLEFSRPPCGFYNVVFTTDVICMLWNKLQQQCQPWEGPRAALACVYPNIRAATSFLQLWLKGVLVRIGCQWKLFQQTPSCNKWINKVVCNSSYMVFKYTMIVPFHQGMPWSEWTFYKYLSHHFTPDATHWLSKWLPFVQSSQPHVPVSGIASIIWSYSLTFHFRWKLSLIMSSSLDFLSPIHIATSSSYQSSHHPAKYCWSHPRRSQLGPPRLLALVLLR